MAAAVVHSAHATHTATGHRWGLVFLRQFGDDGFGGEQQARDRGCILQRAAGDLGRVDYAGFDEVFVFARGDVVTFVAFALLTPDDERAFVTRVVGELAEWLFNRAADIRTPTARRLGA